MGTELRLNKLILLVMFLILAKVLNGSLAFSHRNLAWVSLNKGISSSNSALISFAQTELANWGSLSTLNRLDNLVEAKLSENLLTNGSFEYYQQGWNISEVDGIITSVSDEFAYSGERSLKIVFPGEDINFYQIFQKVDVESNQCYQLSAYVKASQLTSGVAIEIWDGDEGYEFWYGGQTQLLQGSPSWNFVSLNFCTPNNVESVDVRFRRFGGKGDTVSGTAWFDDVKLLLVED